MNTSLAALRYGMGARACGACLPLVALVWVALMTGCASTSSGPDGGGPGAANDQAQASAPIGGVSSAAPRPLRDGPPQQVPEGLLEVPDALPKWEPIRRGGPNKPYEVFGQAYEPMTADEPLAERGLASWYGRKFHGLPTASGERYNMFAMTAAHRTMPIPSYARVRNPANGKEVIVRVNDRGPFHDGRVIDLSYTAALKLGLLRGVAPVEVERITFEDIKTGAWSRGRPSGPALAQARAPALAEPPAAAAAPLTAAPSGAAAIPALNAPPVGSAAVAAQQAVAPSLEQRGPAGFWLQLGAFRQESGAQAFHRQVIADVQGLAPELKLVSEKDWFKLQVGPFATRELALAAARELRQALKLWPQLLERR